MTMPQILVDIQNHLSAYALKLSKDHDDGRINSAVNEKQIIEVIAKSFTIEEPEIRAWCDFIAVDGEDRYPVNIKVSELKTADNVQCKLGIYYAVTGVWPTFSNGISWKKFFQAVAQDINTRTDCDYYFLVVGKSEDSDTILPDVILTSLKQIGTLVPNGNNIPFQCHWGKNRALKVRTHSEAVKFILGTLKQSCDLRAKIQKEFDDNLASLI